MAMRTAPAMLEIKAIPKISRTITRDVTLGAAQAMLKTTVKTKTDIYKNHVGIGSMWYEGNPCNMHLRLLSDNVAKAVNLTSTSISRQFNTIGVSDGISMGTSGMAYSLLSREIIANSMECHVRAMHYDALITVPSCDKNIPGALMAMLRMNLPGFMIYGGSIKPGRCGGKDIDVVSAFQSYGEMCARKITEEQRNDIIDNACPGAGSCGGMYTANTMAVFCEAVGITPPNSSSNMAMSQHKIKECVESGLIVKRLIDMDLKPRDIVTKKSIYNGLVVAMALGGSTNMVLHVLAIANEIGINLTYDDIQKISNDTPLIGNLKPSGEYVMYDIYKNGGTASIMKYLYIMGLLDGDCMTITGNTLYQEMQTVTIPDHCINKKMIKKKIIHTIENPIKKNSHIQILYGNIAPDGAVAKITGKEGEHFTGKAMVFDSEEDLIDEIPCIRKMVSINNIVIVIRYQGPSVGMPEMLKATSVLAGLGLLDKVALITDGRFSGGSHGFIIGHIAPEAYKNGPISQIKDNDVITIDAIKNIINVEELSNDTAVRKLKTNGVLRQFGGSVSSAAKGCITNYHPAI